VVKAIFILRYLSDQDLNHRVQLQLNRGEARHELVGRCLLFANCGEFRSGDAEELMNKASCLSLLSNAVLVWNTLRIAEVVDQLRAAGHTIAHEDLARVSPLMHAHVIPNGTYLFRMRKSWSACTRLRANGIPSWLDQSGGLHQPLRAPDFSISDNPA